MLRPISPELALLLDVLVSNMFWIEKKNMHVIILVYQAEVPCYSPQRSTEFVVVHIRFVFLLSPSFRYFLWIDHSEPSFVTLPANAVVICGIREQFKNELP